MLHTPMAAPPPPPPGAPPPAVPPPRTPSRAPPFGEGLLPTPLTAVPATNAPTLRTGRPKAARLSKLDPAALEYELRYDDASGALALDFAASSLTTARAVLVVDLGAQTIDLRVRDTYASVGAEGRLLHSHDPMPLGGCTFRTLVDVVKREEAIRVTKGRRHLFTL